MVSSLSKNKFDRAEHCRKIASMGGKATAAKYGPAHMSAIGVKGFRATAAKFRSVRDYKLWLGSMGAAVYWEMSDLPDTGKFPVNRPLAPWQDGYVEF